MALTKALGGGGGGATITTQDEGSTLSTGVTTLNFVGSGVAASGAGATTTVTIGGGGRVLLDTNSLGVAAATVTFLGIAGTYAHLEVEILARGTTAAISVTTRVQFNSDTGANYDYDRENRFGAATAVAQTSLEFGEITAGTGPAGVASFVRLLVPFYTNTAWKHSALNVNYTQVDLTATGQTVQRAGGVWRSTAAITRMDLILSSGNWAAGSEFRLYGVPG